MILKGKTLGYVGGVKTNETKKFQQWMRMAMS